MVLSAPLGCLHHQLSAWKHGLRTAITALCLGLVGAVVLAPVPQASALRAIKFSHGSGLCNMPLFYAGEKQLFHKYGIEGVVVMTPMAGDSAIQLATGQVEMGVIPCTNAIAAYTRMPAFAVVSGSGIQGLIVVAKSGITSFEDLKGKKIGTFQADTLDIIVYDYLKAKGLTYADVQMQYLGDSVELTNAFIAGHLDAISSIEPYATKARQATNGNVLGDGTDIYGKGYPDCVLVARKELIDKEPEVGEIVCQHVTKVWGAESGREVVALDDVSFAVKQGEFLVVIGPSGCGKSTLLTLLAGLEQPTAGTMLYNGKPITGTDANRSLIFQQPSLYPWLSTLDNVAFGLKLQGVKRQERRRQAAYFLAQVGLRDFASKHPHELSGGMQQRAAIARALCLGADVLLMDEPFAALPVQTANAQPLPGGRNMPWQRL